MFFRACVQPGLSRAPTSHDDPVGARGHSLVLKTPGVMTLSPFRFLSTKGHITVYETQGQASFLQACAQAHFTPALHSYQEAGKVAVTCIQPSLHKLIACFFSSNDMTQCTVNLHQVINAILSRVSVRQNPPERQGEWGPDHAEPVAVVRRGDHALCLNSSHSHSTRSPQR